MLRAPKHLSFLLFAPIPPPSPPSSFRPHRSLHPSPPQPPITISQFFVKAHTITLLRNRLRDSPWGPDVVQFLRPFRHTLDPFVVSQVVKSALPVETALAFFNWSKACPGYSHNLHSYRAMIEVLASARRVEDMSAMVEELKSAIGSSKEMVQLPSLMRWHGRAKDLEGAQHVWDRMKQDGVNPTTESYNIMIDLLAQERRYHDASYIFLQMVEKGCLPKSRTFTILIKHLSKENKLEGALAIFRRFPELRVSPNPLQFLILIVAFARAGNADIVKHLIQHLREEGKRPHKAFYLAVTGLKETGKLEEAESVFRELWPELATEEERAEFSETLHDLDDTGYSDTDDEADLPQVSQAYRSSSDPWLNPNALASLLRDWTPDTVSALRKANVNWNGELVCEVLRGFRKADTAWRFFSWLEQKRRFIHDTFTFSKMILMFAHEKNFTAVNALIEKTKQNSLELSISTINSIIKAYGFAGDSTGAFRRLCDMETCGLKPNRDTFSILIRSLAKDKNLPQAVETLNEMLEAGYQPDVQTLTLLMQEFGRVRDARMVHKLFAWISNMSSAPNIEAHTILMDFYCRSGNLEAAVEIFEGMKSAGIMPTTAMKSILVKRLLREGKVKEARDLKKQTCSTAFPVGIWKASHEDLMMIHDIFLRNLKGIERPD